MLDSLLAALFAQGARPRGMVLPPIANRLRKLSGGAQDGFQTPVYALRAARSHNLMQANCLHAGQSPTGAEIRV
jgi:hypothetical protein